MSAYTLGQSVDMPCAQTVDAVKAGLADQGFGVLSGSCRGVARQDWRHHNSASSHPRRLYAAAGIQPLQADPSIAALLPCNVVVREVDDTTTMVETFDPHAMIRLAVGESPEGSQAFADCPVRSGPTASASQRGAP